ncbi:MAG: topoisomerase [Acidobacteria bacterium]|nr:topoisomerase [Acidobacteriota bacterium]
MPVKAKSKVKRTSAPMASGGVSGVAGGGKKAPGKVLVVVESPAKAKTINRYLGDGYLVKFSLGHIKDLPKSDLGVDVQKQFRPTYEPIPSRAKVIRELKEAAAKASAIYLAADPDREGEAICQHLAEELSNGKPFHRVLFNEITKSAIQEAFRNPGQINERLVEAQQARRILDRLVGYKISPLLWDKVRRGLSAGRVQTVAVRFIVEREREIRAFEREEYWTLDVNLGAAQPPPFDARLVRTNHLDFITKGEGFSGSIRAQAEKGKLHVATEVAAHEMSGRLEKEKFLVASTETKERRRNPLPPFITSTLQQEAARKLGFGPKYAMGLAQRLYEGVECGEEGIVGLITYMRSDSTRVSDAALGEVRDWLERLYGPDYLPPSANVYRSKKGAQDAHEAIRPTSAFRSPDQVARFLGKAEDRDAALLYRLIWQRFVASQMKPALFEQTAIEITAGEFGFRATGSVLKFDGFLKVYEESKERKDEEDEELGRRLPLVKAGEALTLHKITPEQHFTEPPPRYNEASLVKVLEEKGIGRPSTYASILGTIQEREYVQKQEKRLLPTELGEVVTDLLVENFSDIFDVMYTAKLEESLDDIEDGKQDWVATLEEFYAKFEKDLQRAKKHMTNVKRMEEPTEFLCEKCGKPMVIKWGKRGKFLACSGYPECSNTRDLQAEAPESEGSQPQAQEPQETCENCGRPMVQKKGRFGAFLACSGYPDCKTTRKIGQPERKPPVTTDEPCPKCGSMLVIREGRYGEFTSCSNYPKCKFIKQNSTGVQCPECKQGQIVEKRSRRGTFYSCDRYPKCKFSLRHKPLAQPCPQCGSAYLLEKVSKSGSSLECPNETCDYKKAA